jgi:acid stress chaperone HdeB
MKSLSAVTIAVLLSTTPLTAQVIDLRTVSCKDFLASGQDSIGMIMMWLDGYFTGQDDPAVVDFNRMKVMGAKLGDYCAKNPSEGLMEAAEPIMEK